MEIMLNKGNLEVIIRECKVRDLMVSKRKGVGL